MTLDEKLAFCTQFGLETLVVTRGEKGAVAYNRQLHFIVAKPPPSTTVIDTVRFRCIVTTGIEQKMADSGNPGSGASICMRTGRQTQCNCRR